MTSTAKRKQNIIQLIEALHPNDRANVCELLELIVAEENAVNHANTFVVYQDHEAIYHGKSASTALSIFNQHSKTSDHELAFFCIYADHRVSIFGEVQA